LKQKIIKSFQNPEVDKYFESFKTNSVVIKNDGLFFYVEKIEYIKKTDSIILTHRRVQENPDFSRGMN